RRGAGTQPRSGGAVAADHSGPHLRTATACSGLPACRDGVRSRVAATARLGPADGLEALAGPTAASATERQRGQPSYAGVAGEQRAGSGLLAFRDPDVGGGDVQSGEIG